MEFFAGLAFGFLGSLHCIGMCGPLVLAMPAGSGGWGRFLSGRIVYNAGRVVMYSLMGLVIGFVGERLLVPAFQQYISVLAGSLILAGVFIPKLFRTLNPFSGTAGRFSARLKEGIGKLLRVTTFPSLFGLGILNGLLPCGFVYLAIAGAVATGNTAGGVIFMAGFGIGTIPAMIATAIFPRVMTAHARIAISRYLPILTVLIGLLLIARGLNLGIPYVSPKLTGAAEEVECCH